MSQNFEIGTLSPPSTPFQAIFLKKTGVFLVMASLVHFMMNLIVFLFTNPNRPLIISAPGIGTQQMGSLLFLPGGLVLQYIMHGGPLLEVLYQFHL